MNKGRRESCALYLLQGSLLYAESCKEGKPGGRENPFHSVLCLVSVKLMQIFLK